MMFWVTSFSLQNLSHTPSLPIPLHVSSAHQLCTTKKTFPNIAHRTLMIKLSTESFCFSSFSLNSAPKWFPCGRHWDKSFRCFLYSPLKCDENHLRYLLKMSALTQQLQDGLGTMRLHQPCWSSWVALWDKTVRAALSPESPTPTPGDSAMKMRTKLKEDLSSSHKEDGTAAAGAQSQNPGIWGWVSIFSSHLPSPETHYQNHILPSSDRAMPVSWGLLPLPMCPRTNPVRQVYQLARPTIRWLELQLALGSLTS